MARAPVFWFLLALAALLEAKEAPPPVVKGRVFVEELPPRKRRDEPFVYAWYAARSYDPARPAPLILALHAGRGTARRFALFLSPLAEARGAVLVCPQGIEEVVGADGYWWKGSRREMECIDRVLKKLRPRFRLDEKRFYLIGLADGAELGLKWGVGTQRGLAGMILINFLWKPPPSPKASRKLKLCLIASRDAREKSRSLRAEAEKAAGALRRARYPVVLRIVPGASRSFFHGWEGILNKACDWFAGKRDWPAELAAPPPPPGKGGK